MDRISPKARSALMAKIRSKNTKPERALRRMVSSLGFRHYRLNDKRWSGSPDISFARMKKVIFVHGCFFHQHPGCQNARVPKTRRCYWEKKFSRNQERDKKNMAEIERMGWQAMVVWECEIKEKDRLIDRLAAFLKTGKTR